MAASPLGHNPNATREEMLRERETFNLREHLRGIKPEPPPATPPPEGIKISREQVIILCHAYGIDLLDDPDRPAGSGLPGRMDILTKENERLLDRCRLAEAAAAGTVRELAKTSKELEALKASTSEQFSQSDFKENSNGNT